MTANDIIDDILRREGPQYTNRPNDRGGPTKYGVTQATLSRYRGRPVSPADVQSLTEPEARAIYLKDYVVGPGFLGIKDERLRALMVDCRVNHSPKPPMTWLQKAVGVAQDGVLGPATLAAVNAATDRNWRRVFADVIADRTSYYGMLVTKDPTQAENAHGWNNRAGEFIRMLGECPPAARLASMVQTATPTTERDAAVCHRK